MEPSDPYGAPARRTQWIVSTLAFHYGLDRGVENEIIVLATGLDQYLQEVFHHLDHRGGGRLPVEDFHILCDVLGLDPDDPENPENLRIPENRELSFRHFHARLCGLFSSRAGRRYEAGGLLVGKDSEHIETQIRLRRPLKQREKPRGAGAPVHAPGGCRAGPCTRECYEDIVALEEAEDRVSGLEAENQSLRELVEDMRAALQSSDARCVALQVGLWKSQSGRCSQRSPSVTRTGPNTPQDSNPILSSDDQLLALQELLSGCRGRRQEEADVHGRGLEQQLWSSEDTAAALQRERQATRRKMEDARWALLRALRRVKELEADAAHLPALHRHIQELESELRLHRSKAQQPSSTRAELRRSCSHMQHDRRSPTGQAETPPDKMDEQLFRSVEGQAASDEENDTWTGEQEEQEEKILRRFSCCGERNSRCDHKALKTLMSNCGSCRREESSSSMQVLRERISTLHRQLQLKEEATKRDLEKLKESLMEKLQLKNEQTQLLQTERLRLQQLEEKLVDILQLLQKLRQMKVPRRSLGKLLLRTLESCSDTQLGGTRVLQVLNVLRHQLAACELLWRTRWSPDQTRPLLELGGSDLEPAATGGFGSSECGTGWN